jgi:hypothetical protein
MSGREATRKDLPMQNTKQSQCMIMGCWRMFSSDSACEKHKPWTRPVSDGCKDPAGLGMESRERGDGVSVWSVPMDPAVKARLEAMWAARRKSES